MKAIREYADKNEGFEDSFMASLSSVKESLSETFKRLSLKGIPFQVSKPASDALINELFDSLKHIDATFTDSSLHLTTKSLQSKPVFMKFMAHCCTARKYFFMIKKCGKVPCPAGICKAPKMPLDIFQSVNFLPGK